MGASSGGVPPEHGGGVDKGKIFAVAGGGSIGVAAVVGLGMFIRKRSLKVRKVPQQKLVQLSGGGSQV